MQSAFTMVDSRWATTTVVRDFMRLSSACWTARSLRVSRALHAGTSLMAYSVHISACQLQHVGRPCQQCMPHSSYPSLACRAGDIVVLIKLHDWKQIVGKGPRAC